jgi:hypothetical protein
MVYPAPQINAIGNFAVGLQWLNRQAFTTWDMGTVTVFGGPPAGSGWTVYKGRYAHRQTGNGVSGGFYLTGSNFAIYFPQEQQGGAFTDDFRCWRVAAIMAFDAGLGSGDTGIEVGPGLNYDIVVGTPPGFRLAPFSGSTIGLQVRQNGGGAFTINQVVASNIDTTEWHCYELRFIGATDRRDALLKAFVDGRQVFQASWGAGTLLPNWANGTSEGYMVGNGNRGANGCWIANCGIQISAASTEAGLV